MALAIAVATPATAADAKIDQMFAAICGPTMQIGRFVEPIYVRFSLVADLPDFSKKAFEWEIEKLRDRSKMDIFLEPSDRARGSQIDLMLLPDDVKELQENDVTAIVRAVQDGAQRGNVRNEQVEPDKIRSAIRSLSGKAQFHFTFGKAGENLYSVVLARSQLYDVAPEAQALSALTLMLGELHRRPRFAQAMPAGTFHRMLSDDAATAEMSATDYGFFERLYADKRPGPYNCGAK